MLFRLIIVVFLVTMGVLAWRRIAHARQTLVRLSSSELQVLRQHAASVPAAAEALDARDAIYAIPGAKKDASLVEDVEKGLVELLHLITLHRGLERTARELFTDEHARDLVRVSALSSSSAAPDDERAEAEREMETLERQRAARDRLLKKMEELERDMRELSLELRDLHVAVVELAATQGGLTNADTRGAAEKLRATSDGLRSRAEAYSSLDAMIAQMSQDATHDAEKERG